MINKVREWLEDGGVEINVDVVKGALAAVTFIVAEGASAAVDLSEVATAFAMLGEGADEQAVAI